MPRRGPTNRFLFDLRTLLRACSGRCEEGEAPRRDLHTYLDSEWTKHFGHVVTEQLSRLWAVPEARKLAPDLKALLDRRNRKTGITSYELEIFGAAGFCESDITLHHRPVRVERLIAASPMWALPTHVHPDIADLWQTIGERVAARAPEVTHAPRIFLSRRQARRGCRNVGEVEALFATYGFEIVHPEDLPLPAQIKMFREAEVIAGFAGSGMLTNMQVVQTPRHVIVLAPTSYPSRNEYMICAEPGTGSTTCGVLPTRRRYKAPSRSTPDSGSTSRTRGFSSAKFSTGCDILGRLTCPAAAR